MNALLLLGVIANGLVAVTVTISGEYAWLGPVLLGLTAVSVVGVALIAMGQKRLGAMVVIVAALAFVPLGLMAVLGARRVLDALDAERFQKRRAAARLTS